LGSAEGFSRSYIGSSLFLNQGSSIRSPRELENEEVIERYIADGTLASSIRADDRLANREALPTQKEQGFAISVFIINVV
jgi:hypothetical protein